jgi:deoxycytidylate deaminase
MVLEFYSTRDNVKYILPEKANYITHKFKMSIDILKKTACKSPVNNKHSAALICIKQRKENILSTGFNQFINSTLSNTIIDKVNGVFYYRTVHAEINAICQLPKKLAKGNDILVIRINKSNALMNSRPCNNCIDKLQKIGIRKVHYSNEYGEIVSEFVQGMVKIHESSGSKFLKKLDQ